MSRAQRRRNPLPDYQHRLLAVAPELGARGVSRAVIQRDGVRQ